MEVRRARVGEDLDLIVEWARGARTALDVATGGGHVARRLREAGLKVVSADPAPGMRPEVVCRAEDLPFADAAPANLHVEETMLSAAERVVELARSG